MKAGVWSDHTVWSNNMIPDDTTDIVLSYEMVVDVNATCRSLNTNGHNLTVNPNVSVNVLANTNLVVDVDGNRYETITIGTQVWMKRNLAVAHYKNGDPVQHVPDSTW